MPDQTSHCDRRCRSQHRCSPYESTRSSRAQKYGHLNPFEVLHVVTRFSCLRASQPILPFRRLRSGDPLRCAMAARDLTSLCAVRSCRRSGNGNALENGVVKTFYLAMALLPFFAPSALASEFGCQCCQSCGGACVLKVTEVEEDDTCYEVECEEVCIPAVRFPWESCRTPKCGRVRLVAKLKEEKSKKTTCKYEWVPTCTRCGRPASTSNDNEKRTSSGKPSADRTPPCPPMPPPASAARQHQIPLQRAGKSQAVGVANYIGRSSTR